jgi:Zinc dependent phospholipase C
MATTGTLGPTFAPSLGMRVERRAIRNGAISTLHQELAFDAVEHLRGPNAEAWQRLFLRHAQVFALGANAPDADFRDFKNHVLFPADGFWGGAQTKAQGWYRNLVTALQKREWHNAAYCAGVLSHYLADAVHPLHTAQSQADNDMSFALDQCIWETRSALKTRARALEPAIEPQISAAIDFDTLLRTCAIAARAQYQAVVAHFDLPRAFGNPADGLDPDGQREMAIALQRATVLVANVLDAAIAEAAVEAPRFSLAPHAVLSILAAPLTAFSNWRHRVAIRRSLAAMEREFIATGHLEATLSDEVRVKRDAYNKDVAGAVVVGSAVQSRGENVVEFSPQRTASPPRDNDGDSEAEVIDLRRERRAVDMPRAAPRNTPAEPIRMRADVMRQISDERSQMASAEPNLPAA